MTLGIDFDGTFAADPSFFRSLIHLADSYGHKCVLVTGRSDDGKWGDEVRAETRGLIPIVFAAMDWKKEAAEKAGYKIDVWIDDHPTSVEEQHLIVAGRDLSGGNSGDTT